MTFALLTAKHHDGFCLWPSGLNTYNVAYSSYPHDIVQQYVDASATATSGNPALAIDGISDFGWNGEATQTLWQSDAGLPQAITLDLGRVYQGIDHLTYLPRQDTTAPYTFSGFITDGNITGYGIAVSSDGALFQEVASGTWAADHTLKQAYFQPARARYVRLEATSAAGGGGVTASEIDTGGLNCPPVPYQHGFSTRSGTDGK
jgi:alpha-L-fucosidase